MIAYCGNDCSCCPRHVATRSGDAARLGAVAELWRRLGFRDTVVSPAEISCRGCSPTAPCRYGVNACAAEKGIENCGQCPDYPCEAISRMFERTAAFAESARVLCGEEEYEPLRLSFFLKKDRLEKARREIKRRPE